MNPLWTDPWTDPLGWKGLKDGHESWYGQLNSFENGVVGKIAEYIRPRLGFEYRLYRRPEGDSVLWGGAGKYVRPGDCDTWAPARDFVAPEDTPVEAREFPRVPSGWSEACGGLVWTRPYWLTDAEPIAREDLLEWIADRVGVLVTDGYITFVPVEGKASLLYWVERDFLFLPVEDVGGAKTYYVYRSTYEYEEGEEYDEEEEYEEEEDFSI